MSRSTGRLVLPWKADSNPETMQPPPERTTRPMRLSAAVAAKKSSERLISPITVSVTPRMACSTSWGTTSWLCSDDPPPIVGMGQAGSFESFTEGVREGVAGFVSRPFHMGELIETCHRAIEAAERRLREEPAAERRRDERLSQKN